MLEQSLMTNTSASNVDSLLQSFPNDRVKKTPPM